MNTFVILVGLFGVFAKLLASMSQDIGAIPTRSKYFCELQITISDLGVCPYEIFVCKKRLYNTKYFLSYNRSSV